LNSFEKPVSDSEEGLEGTCRPVFAAVYMPDHEFVEVNLNVAERALTP